MNIASSLSGLSSASSSWATQAASSNRRTAQSFSVDGSDSSEATQGTRRGPPPGPPPDFNLQMSTAQFAGARGSGQGDPIASLDADQDGSVSASEFGLSDASSDVQKLFTAIDADQDGSLSSEEIDSFRSQMQEAMKSEMQAGGPPPKPPASDAGSEASSSTDAWSSSQKLATMLQRIAQDYLRVMGSDSSTNSASTQASGSTLSVSA